MARPTLATHPKFAKLVARLRGTPAPKAIARGALELLWESGYAEGNAVIGDAESVEAIAEWTGHPGVLAGHLVAAGFLDVDASGCHAIHDLADHAPDYVARRMARAAERQRKGTSISEIRSQARRQTTNDDDKRISFVTNVDPPAPAPAPAPGSQNPPPARDPSTTEPVAPAHAEPHHAQTLTGDLLLTMFAVARAEVLPNALPWAKPRPSAGKEAAIAEDLRDAGVTPEEAKASMRMFIERALSGKLGADSAKKAENPTYGFGCWMTDVEPLVEEIRGRKPTPAARGSPRNGEPQQPRKTTRAPEEWDP